MNNNSAQESSTSSTSSTFSTSSTNSTASRTRGTIRWDSPDLQAATKRSKASVDGLDSTEEPAGPSSKRSRRDHWEDDEEAASSSVQGQHSSNNNEVFKIAVRGSRRGTADDAEAPIQKHETVAERRAKFTTKYKELEQLGKGGFATVFAGYRRHDRLPVAIKHVLKENIVRKERGKNGKMVASEVAVLLKLDEEKNSSEEECGYVLLLDWYDLRKELVLILERPLPSEDLCHYMLCKGEPMQEEEAKNIVKQLVDVTKRLQDQNVCHQDIKLDNILIETGTSLPRVHLIDFGLSCFVKKRSLYSSYRGAHSHIPPECVGGNSYRAHPVTVWQLGVTLFELLNARQFSTFRFFVDLIPFNCDQISDECYDFLWSCLNPTPENRPTLEQLKGHPWLNGPQ